MSSILRMSRACFSLRKPGFKNSYCKLLLLIVESKNILPIIKVGHFWDIRCLSELKLDIIHVVQVVQKLSFVGK